MGPNQVRNFLLVILGTVLVAFLWPYAVSGYKDSQRTCETDSDCGIVATSCSSWDIVNKKYIRIQRLIGCFKNTSDAQPPVPACVRKRCVAK